jgi:hypothetical protein
MVIVASALMTVPCFLLHLLMPEKDIMRPFLWGIFIYLLYKFGKHSREISFRQILRMHVELMVQMTQIMFASLFLAALAAGLCYLFRIEAMTCVLIGIIVFAVCAFLFIKGRWRTWTPEEIVNIIRNKSRDKSLDYTNDYESTESAYFSAEDEEEEDFYLYDEIDEDEDDENE